VIVDMFIRLVMAAYSFVLGAGASHYYIGMDTPRVR